MKIAIFGRNYSTAFHTFIIELLDFLSAHCIEVSVYQPFYTFVNQQCETKLDWVSVFRNIEEAPGDVDFMISIGGDGTFLDSITYLQRFDIPIIGINSGRLGFLANISKEEIQQAFESIISGNYEFEYRSLLQLESEAHPFDRFNIGLNDTSIQKKDTNLITIDAYINGEFLNTYWTDGLIISTPTGSTAYNLAVGGPIVVPGSHNFVLAPIASHNLTVRPIVIPDNLEIRLEVKSRAGKFLVSVDSRTEVLDIKHNIFYIRKAEHELKMVKLPFNSYFATLRNKLMWGADKRN